MIAFDGHTAEECADLVDAAHKVGLPHVHQQADGWFWHKHSLLSWNELCVVICQRVQGVIDENGYVNEEYRFRS